MIGRLNFNENGRWEIWTEDKAHEITSGDLIEVEIGGYWIRTHVEFGLDGYHATVLGVKLCIGLPAREGKDVFVQDGSNIQASFK